MKKSSFCDKDFIFYEVLGQGGFAIVHRAKCLNSKIPDNFVAIKKIRKENFRRREHRVKEEFKIHSRLNHPNIIKLYGKYEDQKFVYLILELCSKGSLEDYLKREGRLKEAEACKFFKQIVQGIQYLHEKQLVIHRDIALKNILLSEDKTAKLADFGLSVELNHANEAKTTFLGTPYYMPPEAVMNGPHTLKRDCWSLGCVLYTLLVGKSPFDGQCTGDVLTNVIMKDVTFPDDMSREAKELISCLLEREDSKRPGIKNILKFDFFKKHEKDDLIRKLYRNGDSGTGSMASSAMSCSKTSRHFNKTSDSGLDSINSGSAEVRRNSENPWKNKCLDTIQSFGSESIRKAERSLTYSNRESSRESRSRPFARNAPNMIPCHDYMCSSEKVHEKLDSISLSRVQSAIRKNDRERSTSKEKYRSGSLKNHPRHYSSEKENESYKLIHTKAYSCERSVSEERSKHRAGSGYCIDHVADENKVYQRFPSPPCGSGHNVKSRSKSNSYLHCYCSNPESENKICKNPYCRFEKPLPLDDYHKEHLPNYSHSNACKPETTTCSHEHSCHCLKKAPSISQQVKNTIKPTEGSKSKCLSDITEPLNTSRLSPMRKMLTKARVVVSISNEGRVLVESFKKEIISLIFEISPDGKAISLYAPKEKSRVSDKPLSKRNCTFTKGYSFENFPEQHFKFYILAKRTVDIVRAKTAKVIFFGKEGKCVMMENGPCPDYQMELHNGGMVKKTSNEISYIDENGRKHPLFSGGQVDKQYENIWKDFLTMQEQCELVVEHLKPLEESDIPIFPVLCGKRPENVVPIENNKENLKSQSSHSFIKNDENRTLPNTHISTSNYNHVPLEENNEQLRIIKELEENNLARNIDEILVKLKKKPEVKKDLIIAEYYDGYELRCSKDGLGFSFFDPCNRKILNLNSKLKRRLQQDLLGILIYIKQEEENRKQI